MIDKQSMSNEVSLGVTYASLMSAVSLFFTGVLISQYNTFSSTIKVPLIFLLISTFSFIFAATIYNNAGTELTLDKSRVAEKYMVYGKNIVELLGLYLFILATPMVIGAVTADSFLRVTTIIVALTGYALYSQSRFSILEKELPRATKRWLTATITGLAVLLYYTQTAQFDHALFLYSFVAIVLLSLMIATTYIFCTQSKQYKQSSLRRFIPEDAEILSDMIARNLRRVKKGHYSQDVLKAAKEATSPAALLQLSKDKSLWVAEFNNRVVGMGALFGNEISDVYTDMRLQRKGIGRQLVESLEAQARSDGFEHVKHTASSLDINFYVKLGYTVKEEMGTTKTGKSFEMEKKL